MKNKELIDYNVALAKHAVIKSKSINKKNRVHDINSLAGKIENCIKKPSCYKDMCIFTRELMQLFYMVENDL